VRIAVWAYLTAFTVAVKLRLEALGSPRYDLAGGRQCCYSSSSRLARCQRESVLHTNLLKYTQQMILNHLERWFPSSLQLLCCFLPREEGAQSTTRLRTASTKWVARQSVTPVDEISDRVSGGVRVSTLPMDLLNCCVYSVQSRIVTFRSLLLLVIRVFRKTFTAGHCRFSPV
jgi:hypothetical protein